MSSSKRGKCNVCCPSSTLKNPNYFVLVSGLEVARHSSKNVNVEPEKLYWECTNCLSIKPFKPKKKIGESK